MNFYPIILIHPRNARLVFFGGVDFIYLFLERGERREKEKERNISVWLRLKMPPTGDQACNTGMCPEWEFDPVTLWFSGQHSIH